MAKLLCSFLASEDGATAIEYGFLALIMGLGIIASVQLIPAGLIGIFGNVAGNFNTN